MRLVSSVLVLGFGATGSLAAAAINFVGSCDPNSVKVTGSGILTANCKNILGQYVCSKLDLSRCIKNSYGSLQSDPTGAG